MPKKIHNRLKIKSCIEDIVGISTKIEPIVNPIILQKVWEWNLSSISFINFIQIIEPIRSPSIKGNKNGRYSEEIDKRYAL